MFKKQYLYISCFLFLVAPLSGTTPKITVVFVVDQLAYHTFERLSPNFNYGFKTMLNNGVNFTNAHHPHGNPVTATGHATISTGAYAKDHGVVLNGWLEEDGTFTNFGDDDTQKAAVFGKDCMYDYGFSAQHILVDTLSDQLILKSNPSKNFFVYAIAHKPRSAIAMAGKLGKALWFDNQAKQYTSSKAYFDALPKWLKEFNHQYNLANLTSTFWPLFYNKNSTQYQIPFIKNYEFAASDETLASKTIKLSQPLGNVDTNGGEEESFLYEETPSANKTIIDLCKKCIDANDLKPKQNHLMLWVSISNYDMLGHIYGQNSLESTDLLYHLDKQFEDLMNYTQKKVGKKNALFVLTADHGCCPIPELLKAQGFSSAGRLNSSNLKKEMNQIIEQKFGVKKIVAMFKNNQIFLDKKAQKPLSPQTLKLILEQLKTYLKNQQGIKECWTKEDLDTIAFEKNHLEQYYKNQYHPLRSGDLIIMPYPYVYIAKYATGTGHTTAYAYDTQVPLILYSPGSIEKKEHNQLVHITQLVPTLAKIFNISRPSGAIRTGLSI